MHRKFVILFIEFFTLLSFLLFRNSFSTEIVKSPDNKLTLILTIQDKPELFPQEECLYFTVIYNDTEIISESPLSLDINNNKPLKTDLRLFSTEIKKVVDFIPTFNLENDSIPVKYNKITLHLQEKRPPFRFFAIEFILHNHGIAYRYILPAGNGISGNSIKQEKTIYCFPEDYSLIFPDTDKSGTQIINHILISDTSGIKNHKLPVLLKTKNNIFIKIFEPWHNNSDSVRLNPCKLVRNSVMIPRISVKTENTDGPGSRYTNWRCFLIGENPGIFTYTNLPFILSGNPEKENTAWINKGLYIDTEENISTDSLVSLIKYCSANNVDFIFLTEETFNSIPDKLSFNKLLRKNRVSFFLRVNEHELLNNLKTKIKIFADSGAAGIFVSVDAGKNLNGGLVKRILSECLTNRLLTGFQAGNEFTGLSADYPNFIIHTPDPEFAIKSKKDLLCFHTLLPFFNMTGTPTDLCGVSEKELTGKDSTASVYNLALNILSTSGLRKFNSTISTTPDTNITNLYYNIPFAYDQTKFINGIPGQYMIVARKKASVWYIAAISNTKSGTIELPVSVFDNSVKKFQVKVLFDTPSGRGISSSPVLVRNNSVLTTEKLAVILNPGKGYVAVLQPADQ